MRFRLNFGGVLYGTFFMSDEILDLDYKPLKLKKSKLIPVLFGVAIALFLYWYFGELLFWPFRELALLAGLIVLGTIATIRLFRNRKQGLFQYFYFAGKLFLFVAIYLNFNGIKTAYYFMGAALLSFLTGIILLYRKKTGN